MYFISKIPIWLFFIFSIYLHRVHNISFITNMFFLISLVIVTLATLNSLSANSNIWFILHVVSIDCLFVSGHFTFSCFFLFTRILYCFLGIVNVIKTRICILLYSSEKDWHFCFRSQCIWLHLNCKPSLSPPKRQVISQLFLFS